MIQAYDFKDSFEKYNVYIAQLEDDTQVLQADSNRDVESLIEDILEGSGYTAKDN